MRKKSKNLQSKKDIKEDVCKWYALVGYNVNDIDNTGMLSLEKSLSSGNSYKITRNMADALKFPSMNINRLSSFASPSQWLDFFSKEPELSSWKFHLINVKI